MEGIPELDDLKVELLKLLVTPFGVAGAVLVALYVVWRKISAYVEALRGAISTGQVAFGWLARQLQRQRGELWYGVVTTVVMLSLQVVWLGCAAVMGGLISRFVDAWDDNGQSLGSPGEALLPIQWDNISKTYFLICLVSVVASYMFVKKDAIPVLLFMVCSLPGWFWGAFGALGAALSTVAYLVGLDIGIDSFQPLIAIWVLVAAALAFLGITYAAMTAPSFIRRAWVIPQPHRG